MNIIFMGTPEFAVPSLEILLSSHHNISGVVTVPDKPQGRGLKLSESDVKRFAVSRNLKVFQPDKLKDNNFINEIKNLAPELIVVVAFRILPKEVFTIPKLGSFNLHASLLPKYRGAAPINWALINGDNETGVTTFFLKEKVDTGNVIIQNKCPIDEDDDAGTLHDKLSKLGASTVLSTVNLIEMTNGNVPVYEQDEVLFTTAPKITKEFCRINWDNTANTVYNFIRGLSPYPAAYSFADGKMIKIFKTAKADNGTSTSFQPGKIRVINGKILVDCADGILEILSLQMEGKKRLNSREFLNGFSFPPEASFDLSN
ncbi:MAG: methionyl-tRNA formyltransferase [Ignavibacteria bacterium]